LRLPSLSLPTNSAPSSSLAFFRIVLRRAPIYACKAFPPYADPPPPKNPVILIRAVTLRSVPSPPIPIRWPSPPGGGVSAIRNTCLRIPLEVPFFPGGAWIPALRVSLSLFVLSRAGCSCFVIGFLGSDSLKPEKESAPQGTVLRGAFFFLFWEAYFFVGYSRGFNRCRPLDCACCNYFCRSRSDLALSSISWAPNGEEFCLKQIRSGWLSPDAFCRFFWY